MLPSDCEIRIHFRDVSDFYYAKNVGERRLQRQVLAPRVPVSWFCYLGDASLDLLPLDGLEPWVSSDLVQNPSRETVDPCRHGQMAVAAVIMGDLNPGCAFLRSATIGDAHTDDIVIPAVVYFSRLHLKDDFIPVQRADTLYGGLRVEMWSDMRCGEASWTESGESLVSAWYAESR